MGLIYTRFKNNTNKFDMVTNSIYENHFIDLQYNLHDPNQFGVLDLIFIF